MSLKFPNQLVPINSVKSTGKISKQNQQTNVFEVKPNQQANQPCFDLLEESRSNKVVIQL